MLGKLNYSLTLSTKGNISDGQSAAAAVIDKAEDIVPAAQLVVDGSVVAHAEKSVIESALQAHKDSFSVAGAECTSSFVENVEVVEGYYVSSSLDNAQSVKSAVSALSVKTVASFVTDIETKYKSVTKRTSEKQVGYSAVTTVGKNGVTRVTEQAVYLNGAELSREQTTAEVISTPVDEVVTVGTAKSASAARAVETAHNSGFIFPLPSGVWQVSAYFGDGRGHKGIDLRAPKGTAIYAVAGGTVTYSGYHSGFGNYVKIDHGNGLSTIYAHASTLCVKKGDTVSAGDVIALVGSTGNSTGNHLHFSVLSGSTYLNPAPYINLG